MNILLTSVGRRTYLIKYFKEALNGDGEVHAANSIYTYALIEADKWLLSPSIYDNNYIDFLLDYCKSNGIKTIISLFDIDLPVLAKAKDRFKEIGVKVIVSDREAVEICNDKWKTYLFLQECGLLAPKTFIDLDKAESAIRSGEIAYPIYIKPRWGMGSIGVYKIENEDEFRVLYVKLKRHIFDTYLKFESKEDMEHCIIIQESLTGDEYGLDILNNLTGKYETTVAKKKIAMRAGETDVAEIVDPEPFIHIGKTLSRNLSHIANLDVDCFMNEKGEVYVLELNCRFGGQYPFSHLAGVNFPKQIVEWLKGNPTEQTLITPTIGVKSCKDLTPVMMVEK